jgi:aspartyl-tRNA(Asn)/glutamyl-tRNA(Gln) amidotransferase subunit B
MTVAYEAVVGLEVHAQLLTRTKLFCGCAASFGDPPNTHVCPTCLGLPGALPVLNAEAVAMAVRTALALGCALRTTSRFARKNYFYPDLPKGYQISQFDEPYSEHGELSVGGRAIRIRRVHMEEDAGKSIHDRGASAIVDLNRAGVPLVEIVGEPDLKSGAEAAEYLRTLRDVLVFLGVNDGNLEEGSFRCDANVSIRPVGTETLGTRVELKNINSFKFVEKAIDHEVIRQQAVLDAGGAVVQETRGWDEKTGKTFSLRGKEEAHDYRYFPDPDLPPLVLDEAAVARAKAELPELPAQKRVRYTQSLGLSAQAAGVLTSHPRVAELFEKTAALAKDPVKAANFVQSEVLRDATFHGQSASFGVTPEQIAGVLALVDDGTISGKQAKDLYAAVRGTPRDPKEVAAELGMAQVTDTGAIDALCKQIVDANAKQTEAYRSGKTALFGFFVGQVMKASGGKANPQLVNAALKKILEGGA